MEDGTKKVNEGLQERSTDFGETEEIHLKATMGFGNFVLSGHPFGGCVRRNQSQYFSLLKKVLMIEITGKIEMMKRNWST